ncbi:hypothetical protein [Metaclostridioides mangenotii]|uniref:hypothetical protein n=1 Tax=Metaclostridioides mangenotii TaxID=1540 RepID=UPI0026E9BAD5|nr:hypothetical protein [Clostridioides mangenotii]
MRAKIILMITLVSLIFVGCSFNNKDVDYFEKGTQELEDSKYKEAMKSFSTVLDDDDTNQNAKAMYLQAMRMSKALKFKEEDNYRSAIEQLDFISKIKNGSSTVKSEATKLKKQFKDELEEENKNKESRKESAKNSAKDDLSRVEQDAANAQYGRRVRKDKYKNQDNNSNSNHSSGDSGESNESSPGGTSGSDGKPESGSSQGSNESGGTSGSDSTGTEGGSNGAASQTAQ